MPRSKTLLVIGLAALGVSVVCNLIIVVAGIRAKKDLLLVYTRDFDMPHKSLLLTMIIISVVVGVGGVVGSIVVGRSEASDRGDHSP